MALACLCRQEVLRAWHQVLHGAWKLAGHVVGVRGTAESQETSVCVVNVLTSDARSRETSADRSGTQEVPSRIWGQAAGCPRLLCFLLCPPHIVGPVEQKPQSLPEGSSLSSGPTRPVAHHLPAAMVSPQALREPPLARGRKCHGWKFGEGVVHIPRVEQRRG